jgi:hypothetical protein
MTVLVLVQRLSQPGGVRNNIPSSETGTTKVVLRVPEKLPGRRWVGQGLDKAREGQAEI